MEGNKKMWMWVGLVVVIVIVLVWWMMGRNATTPAEDTLLPVSDTQVVQ